MDGNGLGDVSSIKGGAEDCGKEEWGQENRRGGRCGGGKRKRNDWNRKGRNREQNPPGKKRRSDSHKGFWVIYISIWGIMLLLHVLAWSSEWFCDWYLYHIYGIWVDTYGRAMGMVPFSVGEILIGLGMAFVAAGVLLGGVRLICRAAGGLHGRTERSSRLAGCLQPQRLKIIYEKTGRWGRTYVRAALWLLLTVFILMTLNCYILYHASGFAGTYLSTAATEYSLEELEALRNFVVEQCNALCCQMPRNEDGSLSYDGDMADTARKAMEQLGIAYSLLEGFYPVPKPLRCSDFMSMQYVAGCFYPFSMEANYNDVMYEMNKPSTICHELAHLKGFIREDEANLVGYLACIQSQDLYFRYSGYLSVLYYIDNDFREAAGRERYLAAAGILPQVHQDNIFLPPKERIRIEQTALLPAEAVDAVSDQVSDARLKLNGVAEGMESYSKVVELLLRYYNVYGYGK